MPGPGKRLLAGLALALVLGAAGSLPSCGDAGAKRPNVLLITVDTLRADHLSAYGFRERQTPNIDRLADEGALFTFAHTDVTWTTPSMVSTLTGMTAARHGFRSYYDVLPEKATTVAELLAGAGYRTAAVIAAYPLDSVFGLDQGFETYDDRYTRAMIHDPAVRVRHVESKRSDTPEEHKKFAREKALNDSWRTDPEVTEAALARLDEMKNADGPFFLWVHYFGPHSHLEARLDAAENERRHVASYADKVARTDTEIGRLLAFLDTRGLTEDTLVILHADHGESLGERGFVGHGQYLYENTLRVPLVMRWPGRVPAGRRLDSLVGNIDIAPTILAAAQVEGETHAMDGKSILPLLRGARSIHEEMYGETFFPAHSAFASPIGIHTGEFFDVGSGMRGVLRPPWKYVLREARPFFEREGREITPEI
ncbi:MAG: sulfatase, partial [Myxococcota bacterium]